MLEGLNKRGVPYKVLIMGAKGYITKPLDRNKVLLRIIPVLKQQ